MPAPPAPYAAGPGSYPAAHVTPGAAKKNRLPLILGIVGGVVLLGIVAAIVLVTGVFKSASDPKDTVNDFVTAANSNDCDGMIALVTQRYKDDNYFDTCEGYEASEESNISYEIEGVSISGDTATVTGALTDVALDVTYDFDFGLVKDDGKWKIDELIPG